MPAGITDIETKVYTLKAGKTTSSVAHKYHMSFDALRKLNQLRTFVRGFENLKEGDELDVPLTPFPEVKWESATSCRAGFTVPQSAQKSVLS